MNESRIHYVVSYQIRSHHIISHHIKSYRALNVSRIIIVLAAAQVVEAGSRDGEDKVAE